MIALFKDRSPATFFWLIILSIVVHSNFFVNGPVVNAKESEGLLSVFINAYISHLNPTFIVLIYHGLIILQSLRLNHLFTDHRMYSRANYLPAMVYILLTGIFTEWGCLTSPLIMNTFLLWLFASMIRLYNNPKSKTLVFNIGLITGLSVILYHPCALLIPVALFAVMILRPFIIAEWVIMLMGVIFPFYLLFSYLYLNDRLSAIKTYIPDWRINVPHIQNPVIFFATVAIFIIIFLIGLFYWQLENRRLLIQVRKNWIVLLVMFFVLLPLPFINRNAGIESLVLCIVPASPLIAKGFLAPKKNTVPAIMFWIMLILIITKNWQLIK